MVLIKKTENIYFNKFRKKYSGLFKNPVSQDNRIRWKEVCSIFKTEVNNESDTYKLLGKHCRERWINHLNPQIKKFFLKKKELINN
jgi:hypothetical protein